MQPVEGEQHSVCANQGSWKSLVLYYWGQYLVVEWNNQGMIDLILQYLYE